MEVTVVSVLNRDLQLGGYHILYLVCRISYIDGKHMESRSPERAREM
jgi:hypothetical protein